MKYEKIKHNDKVLKIKFKKFDKYSDESLDKDVKVEFKPQRVMIKFKGDYDENWNYRVIERKFSNVVEIISYFIYHQESKDLKVKVYINE